MIRPVFRRSLFTQHRRLSSVGSSDGSQQSLSINDFHQKSDNVLEVVSKALDEANDIALPEITDDFDYDNSQGVLTIKFGLQGTWVLNKQPPNLQLWLSSPWSGPKRFEFKGTEWVDCRDKERRLHDLLQVEFKQAFKIDEFSFEEPF